MISGGDSMQSMEIYGLNAGRVAKGGAIDCCAALGYSEQYD
jgi:hypothetical protein